ncbi:MAG: FecR domain-containing protein [Spirochaetales bacterium]|nr:FecR domain-containing protein [Spirochaetales bacterium]
MVFRKQPIAVLSILVILCVSCWKPGKGIVTTPKQGFITVIEAIVKVDSEHALLGDKLEEKSIIETDEYSYCEIQFGENAVIRMEEKTTLLLETIGVKPGYTDIGLVLKRGAVLCNVENLSGTEAFRVKTDAAGVTARSAGFRVEVSVTGETTVSVDTGSVLLLPEALEIGKLTEGPHDTTGLKRRVEEAVITNAITIGEAQTLSVTADDTHAAARAFGEGKRALEAIIGKPDAAESDFSAVIAIVGEKASDAVSLLPRPQKTPEDKSTLLTPLAALKKVKVTIPFVIKAACGEWHSMALKSDGTLWASGGQAGRGTGRGESTGTNRFVRVLDNVIDIACGGFHSLALKRDGTLWATGWNGDGQLGTRDFKERKTFVRVLENVEAIGCGYSHSLAVKKDDTLWTAGRNDQGQLGLGNGVTYNVFLKALSDVAAAAGGGVSTNDANRNASFSFAIKNDGILCGTGSNKFGQLGIGDNYDTAKFYPVFDDVSKVACGFWHSMAIRNDGSLWVAGSNAEGQLGTGDKNDSNTFIRVLSDVAAVGCGTDCSFAVKNDGSLWATGDALTEGKKTGLGKSTDRFVKIMDEVNTIASRAHTIVVKADGTVWVTGLNREGELGTGDTTDRFGFTEIVF